MKDKRLYIVITPFFPSPDNFRGAFVYDQVRAIERNSEYKVIVFKPTSFLSPESDYEYEGIKIYRFKTVDMPAMLFNGLTNGINTRFFIDKIKELEIDIDAIAIAHGHTAMFSGYALELKKHNEAIKTVVQHHDPDPFGLRSGRLVEWTCNARFKAKKSLKLFKQIDLHLCISKYVENNLKLFPGHSSFDVDKKYLSILDKVKDVDSFVPSHTYVLYNGVDMDIFFPNPIPHDHFVIGCIANIGDWKDQMTLLRAVKVLHGDGETDIRLVLIGSGEGENECRDFIVENGLEDIVEIRHEVMHKDLSKVFNSFDLFVLPSYFEGFGCVFTEAAACGVPFIACEGQGATEYLQDVDKSKWTIKPFDYLDLAQKIKSYKNGRTAQKLNRPLDINVLIREYIHTLDKLNIG